MHKKIVEESMMLNGQKLTLQFGKLAQAVDMSVFATLGETSVLVTVAVGVENPAIDYFPLSVEYVEKLYAGGLIKGSRWVKREGRPSDEAILTGRLIDRGIRPLFPKAYKNAVQVIITLLSLDGVNSPDLLASIAVSAALHASSVPWSGPVSTSRIGYLAKTEGGKEELVLNPSITEKQTSSLDLVVTTTKEKALMIETEALAVDDSIIQKGIEMALAQNKEVIEFIEKTTKPLKKEKGAIPEEAHYEELLDLIEKKYKDQIELIKNQIAHHDPAGEAVTVSKLMADLKADTEEKFNDSQISAAITKYNYTQIKKNILEKKERPDGRKLDEVREIYVEAGILPRTHGSAIFQRGQTQVLSIVTLGSTTLEQTIEGPEGTEDKRYIHHYSDGPYSYGTTGRIGSPSRRAIGHGALAEKALEPVLPSEDEFPYTIRVVSEILAENGSSSMGSASGSSLALMDAGVPLKAPVAGIAMGIVTDEKDNYVILTDIIGLEDFSGEMDFKVAGTAEGVTAIQLDVKNKGLNSKMIKDVFEGAKKARLHILDEMNKVISKPRATVSQYAPKVVVITPPQDKIGEIIGPGGRNIRAIIAKTGTEINIDDNGKVTISGINQAGVDEAVATITNMTRPVEIGETFEGPVKRILPFGAFVEIISGKEGMVHVSKMSSGFVKDPNEIVKLGQIVKVEVIKIDDQGRIDLKLIRDEKSGPAKSPEARPAKKNADEFRPEDFDLN